MVLTRGASYRWGITAENAEEYLNMGASHCDRDALRVPGQAAFGGEQMERLKNTVGKERIVIDVSCRKREDDYYIVTDRWQNYTDVRLTEDVLRKLEVYCDEFLVHGVDWNENRRGLTRSLPVFWEIIMEYLLHMQEESEASRI